MKVSGTIGTVNYLTKVTNNETAQGNQIFIYKMCVYVNIMEIYYQRLKDKFYVF